jgi:hypothetical protein
LPEKLRTFQNRTIGESCLNSKTAKNHSEYIASV